MVEAAGQKMPNMRLKATRSSITRHELAISLLLREPAQSSAWNPGTWKTRAREYRQTMIDADNEGEGTDEEIREGNRFVTLRDLLLYHARWNEWTKESIGLERPSESHGHRLQMT